MDLLCVNEKALLHVVDCREKIQNAGFVKYKAARALCSLFVEIWPTVYSGYVEMLKLDRETSFMARKFIAPPETFEVAVQGSDIESHNALVFR